MPVARRQWLARSLGLALLAPERRRSRRVLLPGVFAAAAPYHSEERPVLPRVPAPLRPLYALLLARAPRNTTAESDREAVVSTQAIGVRFRPTFFGSPQGQAVLRATFACPHPE